TDEAMADRSCERAEGGFEEVARGQPDGETKAGGDDEQVIELAEERDKVRDEVEGHRDVEADDREDDLGVGGHFGVAEHAPDKLQLRAEGELHDALAEVA